MSRRRRKSSSPPRFIVHQDELEPLIAARLLGRKATSKRLEYLVLDTVDPRVWRRGLAGGASLDEVLQMQIEQTGGGWQPAPAVSRSGR
jgi:hypothetical protein